MRQATTYFIFSILFLLVFGVEQKLVAQHYIGVRGGYGIGSVRIYPKEETASVSGLISGGIMWKHYTKERGVGGIEIDILFMQQGYKRVGKKVGSEYNNHIGSGDETAQYIRHVNSIMVPIFWQPHVYFFRRKLRVYMNIGVTFSYNYSSNYEVTTDDLVNYPSGVIIPKQKYPMSLTRDNPLGYGLAGGVGASMLVKRFEFFVEGRYFFGYGDILRNYNKYEENPLRSPLDRFELSAGITYRLGKGDIRAKLGKKMQREILEREREIVRKNEEMLIEMEAEKEGSNGVDNDPKTSADDDGKDRRQSPIPIDNRQEQE